MEERGPAADPPSSNQSDRHHLHPCRPQPSDQHRHHPAGRAAAPGCGGAARPGGISTVACRLARLLADPVIAAAVETANRAEITELRVHMRERRRQMADEDDITGPPPSPHRPDAAAAEEDSEEPPLAWVPED